MTHEIKPLSEEEINDLECDAIAKFGWKFSPKNVLALIATIRQLQEENKKLNAEIEEIGRKLLTLPSLKTAREEDEKRAIIDRILLSREQTFKSEIFQKDQEIEKLQEENKIFKNASTADSPICPYCFRGPSIHVHKVAKQRENLE